MAFRTWLRKYIVEIIEVALAVLLIAAFVYAVIYGDYGDALNNTGR